MKKHLIICLLVTLPFIVFSQEWKHKPFTFFYSNGTNHFLGELGGGKKDAAHFLGLRDIDYQATRPTWQVGVRYKFHEYFAARINYTYALISGSDANSGNYGRLSRNLSFRSGIYEMGAQVEYYFVKEKSVIKSSFGSLKGYTPISAYLFLGFGGLYFNPKAKHPETGKWISLRPLGTEGQFANPDGTPFTYTSYYVENGEKPVLKTPKPYSRFAGTIYMGVGVKYDINKQWSVGMEISNRYTTTDYIDDCHDRYFNYSNFGLTPPSPYTTVFSDRHLTVDHNAQVVLGEPAIQYDSGKSMRGDPNYNDAYIVAVVTVFYKLNISNRFFNPKFK